MMTLESALAIAEQESRRRIAGLPRLFGVSFSPTRLWRENARTWTFVTGSRELVEQGYVPGGIIITVDKTDGHIWTEDDFLAFAADAERLPASA